MSGAFFVACPPPPPVRERIISRSLCKRKKICPYGAVLKKRKLYDAKINYAQINYRKDC
jgi:hypothetical protein